MYYHTKNLLEFCNIILNELLIL